MLKSIVRPILFLGLAVMAQNAAGQTEPYRNPELSADERARDLLSRLTLEEKISMMTHTSPAIERLGIPEYNWWNEALHGVGRAGTATVFPQAIALAATFDDKAVGEVFDMVSDEARVKYNRSVKENRRGQYRGLTYWTPNINIFRDPRWGRGQETYGEDPYLTTRMGLAVIRGLQGDGSGKYDKLHACAKHFAVHSGPEWNRHTYNAADISVEDLWETFLPAFKAAVLDGHVKEVMCAYNRYEDEPCCSNKKLLKKILREDWGYDDVVVSDCWALADFYNHEPTGHGTHRSSVDAAADALLSGNDLECGNCAYPDIKRSIEAGLMDEADLDRSVFRLLRARFQLGNLFDDELTPWWNLPDSLIACAPHRAKALEMARKGIVLMTNRNNTLPLDRKMKKIAVLGPNANDSVMMWGNYCGTPKSTVTVLDGMRAKFPDADIVYIKGCDYVDETVTLSEFDRVSYDGHKGMKASFWSNSNLEGEPMRVTYFSQPLNFTNNGATAFAPDVPIVNFSARFEGTYIPDKSGQVTMHLTGDDGVRLIVDGKTVIDKWKPGYHSDLSYTLDVSKGHKYDIVLEYYQAHGSAELKFDFGEKVPLDYAQVAAKVADADVIVFAGGLSPMLEGEEMGVHLDGFRGGDRTAIELPNVQTRMLQALKATGRPVVFVLCTGSAVAIPWAAENCDALLTAFYPGEAGGTAIADVLAGDYNPSGRLPVTFYAATSDLPDFENYEMDNRTYRYFDGTPLFAFGHGLGYSPFTYGDAIVKPAVGDNVASLTIPVTNVGAMDGDEVVQVYVKNLQDPYGPKKSLRAFRRVATRAGETVSVTFEMPASAFEFFDRDAGVMAVRPGEYEILYGGTSADSSLKKLKYTLTK